MRRLLALLLVLTLAPLSLTALAESEDDEAIDAIGRARLLLIAGTSLVVNPAAGLVRYFNGDHLAIVNMAPTPMDAAADLCIAAPIGEVLDF